MDNKLLAVLTIVVAGSSGGEHEAAAQRPRRGLISNFDFYFYIIAFLYYCFFILLLFYNLSWRLISFIFIESSTHTPSHALVRLPRKRCPCLTTMTRRTSWRSFFASNSKTLTWPNRSSHLVVISSGFHPAFIRAFHFTSPPRIDQSQVAMLEDSMQRLSDDCQKKTTIIREMLRKGQTFLTNDDFASPDPEPTDSTGLGYMPYSPSRHHSSSDQV